MEDTIGLDDIIGTLMIVGAMLFIIVAVINTLLTSTMYDTPEYQMGSSHGYSEHNLTIYNNSMLYISARPISFMHVYDSTYCYANGYKAGYEEYYDEYGKIGNIEDARIILSD